MQRLAHLTSEDKFSIRRKIRTSTTEEYTLWMDNFWKNRINLMTNMSGDKSEEVSINENNPIRKESVMVPENVDTSNTDSDIPKLTESYISKKMEKNDDKPDVYKEFINPIHP